MMDVRVDGLDQENPADQESAHRKCGSGKRDDFKSLGTENGAEWGVYPAPG
jgi:hypothetical protein